MAIAGRGSCRDVPILVAIITKRCSVKQAKGQERVLLCCIMLLQVIVNPLATVT